MSYRDALNFFELNELYTKEELDKRYNRLLKEKPIINLDTMYSILENELNKRLLKEKVSSLENNISKLKEKYKDTKIVYLCDSFENKIKHIKSLEQLEMVKDDFNERVAILKNQIIVPREKEKITQVLNKYLNGSSLKLRNIVLEYIDKINECTTLEEINSIKQKYNKLLEEELKQEKLREKELLNLKDILKKSSIYNFYTIGKQLQNDELINAHKLLITILELVELIDFNNKDFLCNLISELNYKDVNISFNKINMYLKSNDLTIKSFDNELVILNNHDTHHLINLVLEKYYLYATSKKQTIDKLIKDKDNFFELIKLINDMKEEDINKIITSISNIGYKNIKVLIDSLNDFKNPENIYIERKTGRICVFKNTPKKLYTVFLDGEIDNDLSNTNDIIWKYISLLKFFNLAEYSNGLEIEKIGRDEVITLGDYNTNYLYYTNELLLCLVDDGENRDFIFLPNTDDFKFVKGENTQITRNDYFKYYKNKNNCLNDIVTYINSSNKVENKNNEKIM